MNTRRILSLLSSLPLSLAALLLHPQDAAAQATPPHLYWASLLVENVLPEYNTYGTSPSYVTWDGVDGASRYENRTVCTSFLTNMLMQSYDWTSADIRSWLGATSPNAAMYHDAIAAMNGWDIVPRVVDIAPGDVIAMRYPPGGTTTGHVATVVSVPVLRTATRPLVADTVQFEVTVVDSTSTWHGPTDTRLQPDGTAHPGAGIGVMRLYADSGSAIVGYTWSTYSTSAFYDQSQRHLVVGRLAR